MPESFKLLYQGRPGTTAATVYTPGTGKSAIIRHMTFANPTGTDQTLTIWRNGSADANSMAPSIAVLAGGHVEWDGVMCLSATDTLVMKASAASSITVTIDGDEVS